MTMAETDYSSESTLVIEPRRGWRSLELGELWSYRHLVGAFLARARAVPKTFDFLLTGIPGDLSLAYLGAMYDGRQRGSALDYADYHTPRLDSLFARTRTATTRETTVGAWHDVQAELAREQPAAWLYHSRGLQGIARRMQGVRMDLRGELASLSLWSVAAAPGSR